MSQPHPVGIDLGTTWCAVAHIDQWGRSAIVRNAEGNILTPSVVLFDGDEIIVGEEARKAVGLESGKIAECAKRDMGKRQYSNAVGGKTYPPEVIQAYILGKLKHDTVKALGGEIQAVITVPAYFDDSRRKATADAGQMAGIDVLDIVNEPTAAALAYGESLGFLADGMAPAEPMTVLVYDLGGGTFDVTVIKLQPGEFSNLATDGDFRLGGRDWDERLARFAAEDFRRRFAADPLESPESFSRLMHAAEEAKRTLSRRERAVIRFAHAGRAHDVPVTRDQFTEMTVDLLDRTAFTTRQALKSAKLDWSDLSAVLLVGGSSNMPAVFKMLSNMSDVPPLQIPNPDESVARGAALFARHKAGSTQSRSSLEVVDVSSHSLGMVAWDRQTGRDKNVIMIPRHSELPAEHVHHYRLLEDNARRLVIQVEEGELEDLNACLPIGKAVVRNLPENLPKGTRVQVTFRYATNGRLTVLAQIAGMPQQLAVELQRDGGLSDEEVGKWTEVVTEHLRPMA